MKTNDTMVKTTEAASFIRYMEAQGWTLARRTDGADRMTSLRFERGDEGE